MKERVKKEPLLFLCHRIPFPPNKGDKITTYNLLKFLAKRYEVHLACFIDDAFDRKYQDDLAKYCKSYFCLDIVERRQAISGLKALLKGSAVSVEHYQSEAFQQWVDKAIEVNQIEKLFVYSGAMAQFIDHQRYQNRLRVLDMADVDSDKWRQYAESKPWYSKWIYQREQKILANYEQHILTEFEAVTLITDEEAVLFRQLSPKKYADKIATLSNGVDTDYFSPQADFDLTDLPKLATQSICFTGAMDYWANEDAVVWFCQRVWPLVKKANPECIFYIVGGNPSEPVKKLAGISGVIVTGRVPDVRPYIANSQLAVAPMRIARGVQNKILEAMSMAKAVVMTSMGQEGIALDDKQLQLVLDDENHMASQINQLLTNGELDYSENREWIVERYSWDGALDLLPKLLSSTKDKE